MTQPPTSCRYPFNNNPDPKIERKQAALNKFILAIGKNC